MKIKTGVSARHTHLSRADIDRMFGEDYQLTHKRDLNQPGQYLCEEKITILANDNELVLSVVGPERKNTQVEISYSDSRRLGIDKTTPVRCSGALDGAADVWVAGADYALKESTIISEKHLHISKESAALMYINDGDRVVVDIRGKRGPIMLSCVLARVGDNHADEFHIDTDEAAAFGLANGDEVEVI